MKMMACSSIIFSIYLSVVLHLSQGYEVIQPQTRTVNPDRSASITCEHTANVNSVIDVRLNSISPKPQTLCQLGASRCEDIVIYEEKHNKYIFLIFNIGPEAMKIKYVCDFTLNINNIHTAEVGKPTTLLEGQKEEGQKGEAESKPKPQPGSDEWTLLEFILIGLLLPTLLYSCIITFFYFRMCLTSNTSDPENSMYVEMRKAPVPRNPEFDLYS
ncbi:uncharacterized protein LOC132986958 [Labrus mixtus]|uniref:uncharacterized protein LOC132986958 n=1 Tax=Labrus mixtus TaxID=508554 RepID=UPI0029BFF0D8|nr:uncharacterized protein LOC132986958 [Labrus mixtus]